MVSIFRGEISEAKEVGLNRRVERKSERESPAMRPPKTPEATERDRVLTHSLCWGCCVWERARINIKTERERERQMGFKRRRLATPLALHYRTHIIPYLRYYLNKNMSNPSVMDNKFCLD